MRKALMPMVASLALCGAATAALIATTARADQSPKKPVMMALVTAPTLAAETGAPPSDDAGPDMQRGMMPPRDMAARREARCKDMVARETGELAYLESKLALTSTQAPLFAHWKAVKLDGAHKHEGDCLARPARKTGAPDSKDGPNLMDGMAREETMLKTRLADLEAERPSLSSLYASLTPVQKTELGRAAMHKMQDRMHMAMGMMERRGPMGHGPMGRGPDGPGGPGNMPPPPPAQ